MVLYDDMIYRKKSLSDCMRNAVEEGFTEDFKITGNNLTTDDGQSYEADEVTIDSTMRFESTASPGEDSMVYLIETRDGKRGTLVDAYGRYVDTKLASFIMRVEDIEKKSALRERRSWTEFLKGY